MTLPGSHDLSVLFTPANSENSWYAEPKNIYTFLNRQSKQLLVTIGDSWTWGCDVSLDNRDDEYRVQHVFGKLMSDELSADWLNLAIPAQGNFWIASMVAELANIIPDLEYDHILVICTLTGAGRWFNTRFDLDLNYVSWFRHNVKSHRDFDKIFQMLNETCLKRISRSLARFDFVDWKVGTSFFDHVGFDNLASEHVIPRPWHQVLGIQDSVPVYHCFYYNRMQTMTDFLDSHLHSDFKSWFLELDNKWRHRISLLSDPQQFRNYHPLEQGHRAWADYLLDLCA